MSPLSTSRSPRGLAWMLVLPVAACLSEPPEPVRFAPTQPELFAAGGALVDAWADVDGDGDPDRFVGFNGEASRLYRNDRARGFVDVAPEQGLDFARAVRSGAWGDFDRDGDPDLFVGFGDTLGAVTGLYRNDGPSGFRDVADSVGLRIEDGQTRQASWVDYDADGDLDLFLAFRDGPNRLFENGGEEGFLDRAPALGLADVRHTVGAVWFDVGDGRLDLLIANMDGDENALFRQGAAGFVSTRDSVVASGGRAIGRADQGSVRPCVVDFDNDGDFDIFFANYGPNGLLERLSNGLLTNIGGPSGVATDGRDDTCAWGDIDHDGMLELYVNGTISGGVAYRDWLLRRAPGRDVFADVTPDTLLALKASHGASWVDVDLDGDLDLALAGAAPDAMHYVMLNLLRPELTGHSLQVRVLDEAGHATRAGAEIRVYAAGERILLGSGRVDTGSGYNAQSDLPVHFGLAGGQPVDVEVVSPFGAERRLDTLRNIDPAVYQGRVLEIRVGPDGRIVS